MLESYFVKPGTVDRVRCSWIAPEIERYVDWLAEHGYVARCVHSRVPLLVTFGEFAWARGARSVGELPEHVEAFIAERAGSGLAKVSLCECCAVLRGFLRYAHREEVITSDLSGAVDGPQV